MDFKDFFVLDPDKALLYYTIIQNRKCYGACGFSGTVRHQKKMN